MAHLIALALVTLAFLLAFLYSLSGEQGTALLAVLCMGSAIVVLEGRADDQR